MAYASLVGHFKETQLVTKPLVTHECKECKRYACLSPPASQERQGFSATAGMFPRRDTRQSCQTRKASTALRQGAPQGPPSPVTEPVLKGIMDAQNPSRNGVHVCLTPLRLALLKAASQSIVNAQNFQHPLGRSNSLSPAVTSGHTHTHLSMHLPTHIHNCIDTRARRHRDAHRFTNKSLTLPEEKKSACSSRPRVLLDGALWPQRGRVTPAATSLSPRL